MLSDTIPGEPLSEFPIAFPKTFPIELPREFPSVPSELPTAFPCDGTFPGAFPGAALEPMIGAVVLVGPLDEVLSHGELTLCQFSALNLDG